MPMLQIDNNSYITLLQNVNGSYITIFQMLSVKLCSTQSHVSQHMGYARKVRQLVQDGENEGHRRGSGQGRVRHLPLSGALDAARLLDSEEQFAGRLPHDGVS
jgi:hypothetical protein